MSQPPLTGPVADECAAAVRGFLDAMTAFERHLLELRPLRPFGFSEFSEQAPMTGGSSPGPAGSRTRPRAGPRRTLSGSCRGTI